MRERRRGFAVVLALFAVILFGAIATAMAFAASGETRASRSMLGSSQALSAAESAVWSTIPSFDWAFALTFLPGQSVKRQVNVGQFALTVWVTRLDSTCFFVQGSAAMETNVAGYPRFLRRIGVTIEVTRDSAGLILASKVPNRAWTELFQP